jgi:predicted cupin superfamily sugar epimerase
VDELSGVAERSARKKKGRAGEVSLYARVARIHRGTLPCRASVVKMYLNREGKRNIWHRAKQRVIFFYNDKKLNIHICSGRCSTTSTHV